MIGLGVSYLIFVVLGIGEIKFEFFKRIHWFASILALPVMFTSFLNIQSQFDMCLVFC